jgi:hypothetical protein
MFIFALHWDLRALFAGLTITARFYIFGLMAAAVYSTYSSVRIVFRLNRVSKSLANDDSGARPYLFRITGNVETLRQFHTFLFLLFGACCANEAVAILRAIRDSSASLSAARMDIFEPVAAFALFVFAVLLMLHTFQWVVALRLRATVPTNTTTFR